MKLLKKYTAIMAAFTMLTCISPDRYTQTETAIPVYAEMYDSALSHVVSSVDGGEVAVSIDQIELTQEQVKALNYEIPLFVRMDRNPGINAMEFGIDIDCKYEVITSTASARPYVSSPYVENILKEDGTSLYSMMDSIFNIKMTTSSNGSLTWATWADQYTYTGTGNILLIVLTIPHDTIGNLTGGNVRDGYRYYDVAYAEVGYRSYDLYKNYIDTPKADYSDSVEYHDGWVRVKMEEETTTTSTTTSTTTTSTSTTTSATTTTTSTTTTSTTSTTISTTPEETTTTTTTETKPPLEVAEQEITLKAGEQYQIESNQENLIYSSNNKGIAVVSSNGKITALTEGNAIISVINQDDDVVQIKITVISAEEEMAYQLGDPNHDNIVNAKDAAEVLVHSANIGAGNEGTLSEEALKVSDVNADNEVNAKDAAEILVYAAVQGAGGMPSFSSQREPEIPEETTTTTIPPMTASIETESVRYNRTDQTLYFSFTCENVPENSSAWFVVVSPDVPHSETDARNAYISAAYLKSQIGYAGFKISSEKIQLGDYELRIYDPDNNGAELDCVPFTVAEPLKAEILADSVNSSASSVNASFTAENLESNSNAWIGIIPQDTDSESPLVKKKLTECSDNSVEFNFSEKLSAGTYDICIYDLDNNNQKLSSVAFTVLPEVTASVYNAYYSQSYQNVSFDVSAQNLTSDSKVWLGIVPAGTSKTYSATYSARIKWDYLNNVIDKKIDTYSMSGVSSGNYELRICDPDRQMILSSDSFKVITVPAWKSAYKSKLSGMSAGSDLEERRYSLYDLNKDGIPELFISNGKYHNAFVDIYTYSGGSVVLVDTGLGTIW